MRIQERIKSFLWLLGHDRLLNNYKKILKGMDGEECMLHDSSCESSLHLFRDGKKSRHIWINRIPVKFLPDWILMPGLG